MNSRKPKWAKWKLIPNMPVWQVVALSLDIDPDEVARDGNDWMARGQYVNHEGREFQDRLDIVKANYENIDNSPQALSMNGIAYCHLNISKFSSWAIANNIEIPDEMKALASTHTSSEKELFDVNDSKYPKELDAAIKAWQAVSSIEGKGKPKARIKTWLDSHNTFKKLSNEAKERIATVANWDKLGGATRTD